MEYQNFNNTPLIQSSAHRDGERGYHEDPLTSTTQNITVDDILSKIGFGWYQVKAYIILGFILMNDGAESLVLSIIQSILKTQWTLSRDQISWIGTAVFGSFLVGSLISGKITDHYGRQRPLIYVSLLLYAASMGSACVYTYAPLVLVRAFYGFLVEVQFPMCFTYLAEITPKEVRGKYLVIAGSFFTFGELLTCAVSYFALDGISSGNWRALLIWVAQPAILCWIGTIFYIHESPRYLIVSKGEIEQGIEILRKIAKENNVSITLNDTQINGVKRWMASSSVMQNSEVASLKSLFNGRMKYVTPFIWSIWFILSLTYYGMVNILPQILKALHDESPDENNVSDLVSITMPVLGEFPSVVIGYLVVESATFGRKKSMIIGFWITSALCALAVFAPGFTLWNTGARGLLNGVFIIASPYTTELYPTQIRATGLGMASASSRVGGSLMPFVTQSLFEIGPKIPFLGFSLFCLIGGLCCFFIPYDTTKKELDFDNSSMENGQKGGGLLDELSRERELVIITKMNSSTSERKF